jgi:drug/metabolite transporter (DMT)-like permease
MGGNCMSRTSEARFWQAIGLTVGVFGALLLSYTFGRYGLASIDHRAMHYGMASGFMIVAGAAAFLAGRTLHVEQVGLTSRESLLWNLLSAVCMIGGSAVVIFAWVQHRSLLLDRMATGMGGAFAIMLGILCLVGQRVMTHMHDALVVERSAGIQKVRERIEL